MIASVNNAAAYSQQSSMSKSPKVSGKLEEFSKETSPQPVDTFEYSGDTGVRALESLDDSGKTKKTAQEQEQEFREVFHKFVGTTVFGQMLKSMRQTQSKPAFFHGGHAEEIFQGQLDNAIVDKMTSATSNSMTNGMFKQMNNLKKTAAIMSSINTK